MRATVTVDHLDIDKVLYEFVTHEAMPGTGVQERAFWTGFSSLVRALAPRNAELLLRRDELQAKIDAWHREYPGAAFDHSRYKAYLREIGGQDFTAAVGSISSGPDLSEITDPLLLSWWRGGLAHALLDLGREMKKCGQGVVGLVEHVGRDVVTGVDETGLEAAPHPVDHGSAARLVPGLEG